MRKVGPGKLLPLLALFATVAGLVVTAASPSPAGAAAGEECRPDGLYQTPGVAVPYCTVYDTEGRERMGADHARRVIGYFTSWRTGRGGTPAYLAPDIPWDKVTHLNYAFAHLDAQYRVSVGPDGPDNPSTGMTWPGADPDPTLPYEGHFNLLTKHKKQHPDVKTLISVGGWAETGGFLGPDGTRTASGGFYKLGAQPQATVDAFADSAVEFIRKYGFNGVDIDYEYATSNNHAGNPDDFWISNANRGTLWAGYEKIMKSLREKLDRASAQDGRHYLLTAAVPASGWLLRGQEAYQVTRYLDYLNVMSYDLHGAWNHRGPNAALYDDGEDGELAAGGVYTRRSTRAWATSTPTGRTTTTAARCRPGASTSACRSTAGAGRASPAASTACGAARPCPTRPVPPGTGSTSAAPPVRQRRGRHRQPVARLHRRRRRGAQRREPLWHTRTWSTASRRTTWRHGSARSATRPTASPATTPATTTARSRAVAVERREEGLPVQRTSSPSPRRRSTWRTRASAAS
ncbi:hypothetical protein K7G98_05155 [Saccharothrix sp. MB29]|nr:hypothetical protein [Saccharothrix sp. MB29]